MRTRCEADGLSTGALADTSTDVLTKQGFLLDETSATDNTPQTARLQWPCEYGMEYQVESALVGRFLLNPVDGRFRV